MRQSVKYDTYIRKIASNERFQLALNELRLNASAQREFLMRFLERENLDIPRKETAVSTAVLKKFSDMGLIEIHEVRNYRNTIDREVEVNSDEPHLLNEAQQKAFNLVDKSEGHTAFLLHGVTGSGKTEVYMRLTQAVLKRGKSVIVLVPEISLIPQMAERFITRFGSQVAFYHSKMSVSERLDEWQRIKQGEFKIVIGARSAIFAPMDDLGLILIDEEHSKSYKSENEPKYDARHVALIRAKYHDISLVMGSATPSIETYQQTIDGSVKLLELKKRVLDLRMPEVSLVDMRRELKEGNKSIFSRLLREQIQGCIDRGEQSILFINKKGYSSFISCRSCGHVLKCPDCDMPLIYHKYGNYGECRICSYKRSVPNRCPECGSEYFKFFGIGTEKIEEMINKTFTGAKVIRIDSDSMDRKNALHDAYAGIRAGDYNIILGTQIVAKGHDFKNVTLVGILAADINLNVPSFNASETAFQLLTQAIGRSGRGELEGKVVIQTYSPEHYAVVSAFRHDYQSFMSHESEVRKSMAYPPFRNLMNLMILSKEKHLAQKYADWMAGEIKGKTQEIDLVMVGPGPAIQEKAKRLYRFQIILKFKPVDQMEIKGIIRNISSKMNNSGIYINIDVDPISLI